LLLLAVGRLSILQAAEAMMEMMLMLEWVTVMMQRDTWVLAARP
jgi:hypothetical protein